MLENRTISTAAGNHVRSPPAFDLHGRISRGIGVRENGGVETGQRDGSRSRRPCSDQLHLADKGKPSLVWWSDGEQCWLSVFRSPVFSGQMWRRRRPASNCCAL